MARVTVLTARKRGNPNWGMPLKPSPVLPTEFEMEVKRLGLAELEYVSSSQLRRWCKHNRNRVYIPEWLLKEWGIVVDALFSAVA